MFELLLYASCTATQTPSLYVFPSLSPLHRFAPASTQSDMAECFRCGIEKDFGDRWSNFHGMRWNMKAESGGLVSDQHLLSYARNSVKGNRARRLSPGLRKGRPNHAKHACLFLATSLRVLKLSIRTNQLDYSKTSLVRYGVYNDIFCITICSP